MNLQDIYDHDELADPATLRQLQARRRATLGWILIVLGSSWLCLRVLGVIGDVPLPVYWLVWQISPADDLAQLGSLIAYGMLATHVGAPSR